MKSEGKTFISRSRLRRERKWPDGLIERLLGKPDAEIKRRGMYGEEQIVRRYDLERVIQVESTEEFRRLTQPALPKKPNWPWPDWGGKVGGLHAQFEQKMNDERS